LVDLLNDAIKEAYEYAPAEITYWDTLEIDHQDFLTPIRVVAGNRAITTAQGEYLPVNFSVSLPETEGNIRGQMSISVDFLPKEARIKIREAATTRHKIEIKYRQYITTGETANPDAELPVPLQVTDIRETHIGLSITAMFPDLVGSYFPRRLMAVGALPGGRI
jgi:hypothetical protein